MSYIRVFMNIYPVHAQISAVLESQSNLRQQRTGVRKNGCHPLFWHWFTYGLGSNLSCVSIYPSVKWGEYIFTYLTGVAVRISALWSTLNKQSTISLSSFIIFIHLCHYEDNETRCMIQDREGALYLCKCCFLFNTLSFRNNQAQMKLKVTGCVWQRKQIKW